MLASFDSPPLTFLRKAVLGNPRILGSVQIRVAG
jgi:hypothetical protein